MSQIFGWTRGGDELGKALNPEGVFIRIAVGKGALFAPAAHGTGGETISTLKGSTLRCRGSHRREEPAIMYMKTKGLTGNLIEGP
jgi:hypothetical protein